MNIWGRIGVGLAAIMAGYMMLNAVMAWTDPHSFAQRLGLAAASSETDEWIRVYALRAAFIGLLLSGLVLARQWRALFLLSVAALIMPLGDAWLTCSEGSPQFTRHLAIAGIVAISALLLSQTTKPKG